MVIERDFLRGFDSVIVGDANDEIGKGLRNFGASKTGEDSRE